MYFPNHDSPSSLPLPTPLTLRQPPIQPSPIFALHAYCMYIPRPYHSLLCASFVPAVVDRHGRWGGSLVTRITTAEGKCETERDARKGVISMYGTVRYSTVRSTLHIHICAVQYVQLCTEYSIVLYGAHTYYVVRSAQPPCLRVYVCTANSVSSVPDTVCILRILRAVCILFPAPKWSGSLASAEILRARHALLAPTYM